MIRLVWDRDKEPTPPVAPLRQWSVAARHPIWHLCQRYMGFGKVIAVALVVEVLTFWPTHWLFHELGLLP